MIRRQKPISRKKPKPKNSAGSRSKRSGGSQATDTSERSGDRAGRAGGSGVGLFSERLRMLRESQASPEPVGASEAVPGKTTRPKPENRSQSILDVPAAVFSDSPAVRKTAKRSRIKPKRSKKRRGRVVDEDFLAFAGSQPCLLTGQPGHVCREPMTVHHVNKCGSPKHDRRVLPLCSAGHLHDFGAESIERLGKKKWQARWEVSIEAEISRLQRAYLSCHPDAEWTAE